MSGMRILLIEDDPQFHIFVKNVLENNDYCVDSAFDGVEGTRLLSEQVPDLIVIDLLLPKKDGIRFITETRVKYSNIPIIAMLGSQSKYSASFLKSARSLGASQTLEKPFLSEQLIVLIDKCFSGK
jgi:two-component system response regulator TrcR